MKPAEVEVLNSALSEEELMLQKRREFAEKMSGKGKAKPTEKLLSYT